MKRKILGSLVLIGAMGISGTAFADVNINIGLEQVKFRPIAKVQNQDTNQRPELPKDFDGKRQPMMSRDINHRPPEMPEGKRPPMSGDKRPDRKPDRKPDKKPDKKY